jgi:hypothetical protein
MKNWITRISLALLLLGCARGVGAVTTNSVYYVTNAPYNAACDGVTDDTGAITRAYTDAAAHGGTVVFPSGQTCVYNIGGSNGGQASAANPGAMEMSAATTADGTSRATLKITGQCSGPPAVCSAHGGDYAIEIHKGIDVSNMNLQYAVNNGNDCGCFIYSSNCGLSQPGPYFHNVRVSSAAPANVASATNPVAMYVSTSYYFLWDVNSSVDGVSQGSYFSQDLILDGAQTQQARIYGAFNKLSYDTANPSTIFNDSNYMVEVRGGTNHFFEGTTFEQGPNDLYFNTATNAITAPVVHGTWMGDRPTCNVWLPSTAYDGTGTKWAASGTANTCVVNTATTNTFQSVIKTTCTGAGTPWACCTGAGAGATCGMYNALCTANATPEACCTGSGTGTCNNTTPYLQVGVTSTANLYAGDWLTLVGLTGAGGSTSTSQVRSISGPTGGFYTLGMGAVINNNSFTNVSGYWNNYNGHMYRATAAMLAASCTGNGTPWACCTAAGTGATCDGLSGSSVPTFPTTFNAQVTDNHVVWTEYGAGASIYDMANALSINGGVIGAGGSGTTLFIKNNTMGNGIAGGQGTIMDNVWLWTAASGPAVYCIGCNGLSMRGNVIYGSGTLLYADKDTGSSPQHDIGAISLFGNSNNKQEVEQAWVNSDGGIGKGIMQDAVGYGALKPILTGADTTGWTNWN